MHIRKVIVTLILALVAGLAVAPVNAQAVTHGAAVQCKTVMTDYRVKVCATSYYKKRVRDGVPKFKTYAVSVFWTPVWGAWSYDGGKLHTTKNKVVKLPKLDSGDTYYLKAKQSQWGTKRQDKLTGALNGWMWLNPKANFVLYRR